MMGQLIPRTANILLIVSSLLISCVSSPADSQPGADDCISEEIRRVRTAPLKAYLQTLDGQKVLLQEFFDQCREEAPDCVLFDKFYHWGSEVKQVVSETGSGPVKHRIRAYYNPLSICRPQHVHPGRTHGDVAEFYDTQSHFMGLAVYMGQGQYYLLYYSGYRSSETSF